MSPLRNSWCLSRRCSRKRHCDRVVVPPYGRFFLFLRFGHLTSTFLLPFAPPRFAARLLRYYESSDFCRAASSDVADIAEFAPERLRYCADGPGPLFQQCPTLLLLTVRRPRPVLDSSPCFSRLIFRPFRLQPPQSHFATVALSRYFSAVACRVYPPGRPRRSEGSPSHGQGFGHCQQPPR